MKTKTLLLNYRNPIDVIIQEEDRLKAEWFISNNHCLLATALHRMGYSKVSVGGHNVDADNYCYRIPEKEANQLMHADVNKIKPHYPPEVVGLRIQLEPRLFY